MATKPGPIEQIIDQVIDNTVPDLPFIGGAIRGALKSGLHPLFHWVDIAVDQVWQWATEAWNYADQAWNTIQTTVWGWFQSAVSQAIDFANHASDYANSLFTQASRAVGDAIHAVYSAITDAINTAAAFAIAQLNRAADYANSLFTQASRAVGDAIHAVYSAITDAINTAEGVARDIVDTFKRDVFDPVNNEFRHVVDNVIGPFLPILDALDHLAEWIIKGAEVIVFGPFDVADTFRDLATSDLLAELFPAA